MHICGDVLAQCICLCTCWCCCEVDICANSDIIRQYPISPIPLYKSYKGSNSHFLSSIVFLLYHKQLLHQGTGSTYYGVQCKKHYDNWTNQSWLSLRWWKWYSLWNLSLEVVFFEFQKRVIYCLALNKESWPFLDCFDYKFMLRECVHRGICSQLLLRRNYFFLRHWIVTPLVITEHPHPPSNFCSRAFHLPHLANNTASLLLHRTDIANEDFDW